ncbi:MAG: glutamyl-tRNA amidotransferase [Lachnospiraceae bacterium]|nr:glutamyl-tRNA amidotransferase [Lachnospiraceae bacterium]
MILVDIYVPAVDQNYNFSLNEDVPVRLIIDEITEMIAQKEQTHLSGERTRLNLFYKKNAKALPKENTLTDCGIATGASLMLV